MRLFLIDKPGCYHITDLMPGIKAAYQLEQEFHPYLSVEFIPNQKLKRKPGVILISAGEEEFFPNTLDNDKQVDKMRKIIWERVRKIHNPPDITDDKGCLTDFRKTQTNKVIQGWQAKKRAMLKDECCKILSEEGAKLLTKSSFEWRHPMYWLNSNPKQTRKTCMLSRKQECDDNYPKRSGLYKRCMDEVTWLCKNGYPRNKRVEAVQKLQESMRKRLQNHLRGTGYRVNKKVFDALIDAGFLDRVNTRAGNKHSSYPDVKLAITDVLNTEQLLDQFMEPFIIEGTTEVVDYTKYLFFLVILLIVVYLYTKN